VGEALPRQFGAYQLLRKLGQGAASTVYLARSVRSRPDLPLPLVIKCLRDRLARHEEAMQRFQHEARIAVSVDDPHVVKVFDVGSVNEALYIAMEHIRGWPVVDVVAAHRAARTYPPLAFVLQLVRGGLLGLHALHNAINPETMVPLGVVHRDVSARNVMVSADGTMKLIDLGLGRSNVQEWHTRLGVLMGTPGYMSPEQVRGDRVDHRSDLYSFAIVFFELLVLERYIVQKETQAMFSETLSPEFRPPSRLRGDLAPAIDSIFERALALRPEDRFGSALELVAAIDAFAASGPGLEPQVRSRSPFPESLVAVLRSDDEEIARLLEIAPSDEELHDTTMVFADRTASSARTNPRRTSPSVEEPISTIVSSFDTLSATLSAPPSSEDGLGSTLVRAPERDPRRGKTAVVDPVQVVIEQPRALGWLPSLPGAALSLLMLGLALALFWTVFRGEPTAEPILDLTVDVPRILPRAAEETAVPATREAPEEEAPPPVTAAITVRKKKPQPRGIEGTKAVADEARVTAESDSVAAEVKGLLADAAALRARSPEHAAEIDEIVADVSIWSRSTDYERSLSALRALRARLTKLSAKP
jgi:serine/threonine protein kinase